MDSKVYFNRLYQNSLEEKMYSKELLSFFKDRVWPFLDFFKKLEILDLGPGSYSLFEDLNLEATITAFDFSEEAIKRSPIGKISYVLADIAEKENFKGKKWDLIFDSHCLNCLVTPKQRKSALQNIYEALNPNGIFASELMVWPSGKKEEILFKIIKNAYEIEEELIHLGFKIKYFVVSTDRQFINGVMEKEVRCDLLKIIASK